MLVIRLSDQISQREREVGSETERQRDRRRENSKCSLPQFLRLLAQTHLPSRKRTYQKVVCGAEADLL